MNPSRHAAPIYEWPPEDEAEGSTVQAHLETLLAGDALESLTMRLKIAEAGDLQPIVNVLATAPRPGLRRLVLAEFGEALGDWFGNGEPYGYWSPLGDLSGLWAKLPALEELVVQGRTMTLGNIVLPAAKRVAIRGVLSSENLQAIAAAHWPEVERLEIFFGDPADGAEGSVEDIMPILAGQGLPKLRELGLVFCIFIDEVVKRLDQMTVLSQLTSLDLSLSDLSLEAQGILYEQRHRLAHLRELKTHEARIAEWICEQ